MKLLLIFIFSIINFSIYAKGYDVVGFGIYDIKFDGSGTNQTIDLRYERRFDKSLYNIGPENYDFFNLKPFAGFEITSDSATYLLGGVYLEDNIGTIFSGESSNFIFTPSFGAGYYDDGDGKELGNKIEFRTSVEIGYELKNENRIGFSFSHISNGNIGDNNPGAEILNISFQIPY